MHRINTAESGEESQDQTRIHALLKDWRDAISRRDQASYVACYSRDFLHGEQRRRDEWLQSFSGLDDTIGEVYETQIRRMDRQRAKVEFRVRGADDPVERAIEMLVNREAGDWRIRTESWNPTPHGSNIDSETTAADSEDPATLRDQLRPPLHEPERPPRLATFARQSTARASAAQSSAKRPLRFAAIAFNTLVGLILIVWLTAQFSPSVDKYLSRKYREVTNQPLWTLERDQIDDALRAWARAVARKDVDTYLAQYSSEFFGDDPQSRRRWEADRRNLIGRAGQVDVAIRDLELQAGPSEDVVRAYVKQDYRVTDADYLLDKRLVLKREEQGWRIISERTTLVSKHDKAPQPPAAAVTANPVPSTSAATEQQTTDDAARTALSVEDHANVAGDVKELTADAGPQPLYQAHNEIATAINPPRTNATPQASQALTVENIARDAALDVIPTAQSWAEAWSRGKVDEYLSHYGENFQPSGGQSRNRWQSTRRQRLAKPKWIKVELSEFVTKPLGANRVELTFKQRYRSDAYSDATKKVLMFERVDDRWLIVAETAVP